jgi:hypothetical protein
LCIAKEACEPFRPEGRRVLLGDLAESLEDIHLQGDDLDRPAEDRIGPVGVPCRASLPFVLERSRSTVGSNAALVISVVRRHGRSSSRSAGEQRDERERRV